MRIKGLIEEDFIQYKKPSMFIIFPHVLLNVKKNVEEKFVKMLHLLPLQILRLGLKQL